MPVIDYMSEHGKIVQIDCRDLPDEVYGTVEEQFRVRFPFLPCFLANVSLQGRNVF